MLNNNLIFDIGAFCGDFTETCLAKYDNCKIICVEPDPISYNFLIKKFTTENVIIESLVVSNSNDKKIKLYLHTGGISTVSVDWLTKSRFNNVEYHDSVYVNTITLNKLIEKYGIPDLIKIDVEGHEYNVLRGLTIKTPKICFEWAEEFFEDLQKCCNYLKSLGYTKFGFVEEDSHLLEPSNYESLDEMIKNIKKILTNRQEKWGMIWCY